jgi:hypothetical protein
MYKVLDRVKMNYDTGAGWRNLFGTISIAYEPGHEYQIIVERSNGSKMTGYFGSESFTLVENLPASEMQRSAESQERAAAYERRIQGREEQSADELERESNNYWDIPTEGPVRAFSSETARAASAALQSSIARLYESTPTPPSEGPILAWNELAGSDSVQQR